MTNTYNISIVDNTSITRIIRFYYHKCILSVILHSIHTSSTPEPEPLTAILHFEDWRSVTLRNIPVYPPITISEL